MKTISNGAGMQQAARICVTGVLTLSCASNAMAQTVSDGAARHYEIPAGPLDQTLLAIARATGATIAFDAALAQGRRSPGVKGELSREAAVAAALAGSGLTAMRDGAGSWTVVAVPPVVAPPAGATHPGASADLGGGDTKLPDIHVSGARVRGPQVDGFVAQATRSVTHTDTALSDISESVQVITQNALQSQQALSLTDVLKQVGGVTESGADQFKIRGFAAPVRINGGRVGSKLAGGADSLGSVVLASVDHVVVLKGADAISAGGAAAPGGMIDVVTKRPQAEAVRQLSLQGGTRGHKLGSLDLAGAISEDRVWRYRLIASTADDARATDGSRGMRTTFIAPSLGYEAGGTRLIVGAQRQDDRGSNVFPQYRRIDSLGPHGPVYGALPIATLDKGTRVTRSSAFYDLTQEMGAGWTFNSRTELNRFRFNDQAHNCFDVGVAHGLLCSSIADEVVNSTLNSSNTLATTLQAGGVRHTLLAGFNSSRDYAPSVRFASGNIQSVAYARGQLAAAPALSEPPSGGSGRNRNTSMFLQDQLKWGRWNVLANAGKTTVSSDLVLARNGVRADPISHSASQPTYTLGAAYALTDSITAYVNKKKTFEPGNQYHNIYLEDKYLSDYTAPPIIGNSAEFGFKFNLMDDKLLVTTSAYQAKQLNKAVEIERRRNRQVFEVLPLTSKGVEVDIAGRLARGWDVTGSFSYDDFRYGLNQKGKTPLPLLPHATASLWSSYEFQAPEWHGWGCGVGVFYRGGYATQTGYRLPGQVQTDVNVFYKARNWTTTVGVKNVFNRELYRYVIATQAFTSPGRTVQLSAIYNF